jgi:hypothetical protein
MKTTLPIYRCPCLQGGAKHTKVVAVGLLYSAEFNNKPFQICAAHLAHYKAATWRFRVVMLDEFLKYPCFKKDSLMWCSEQYAHICIPIKQPEQPALFEEEPEHVSKLRTGRGDLI